jgi:uncharacterized membrane protein YgdD (TMEM256/DUF423 family)
MAGMSAGRLLATAAGLTGAAGVALSALAAHAGGAGLSTAAAMLLAHAPVLLAVGMVGGSRTLTAAGFVLLAGTLLFSGDLAARAFLGDRLFAYAAPSGGGLMILGWLGVAAGAALRR